MGDGSRGLVVAEIEEGDVGAVPHLEEDMHIGAIFAGRGHGVGLDHVRERQTEQVLVEMPGLLGVPAAPGEMVKAVDGGDGT